MRVAALYDIHGNLPALEAVIRDVRDAGVDAIVIGGDVVPGPMPREVLTYLLDLDIPAQFIVGNGEVAVLQEMHGIEPAMVPLQYRPVIRWTAKQVNEYERVLAAWPKAVRLEIPGIGDALFCHATPRNEDDIFTRLTAEDRLLPIFQGLDMSLVVCGHTHMQFDRMIGTTRVVNAGSVGMPFGNPGADWLMLGPGVELRHTSYDLVEAAECIRRTQYPEAVDFASRNILQPPSEEQMLEVFARAEMP